MTTHLGDFPVVFKGECLQLDREKENLGYSPEDCRSNRSVTLTGQKLRSFYRDRIEVNNEK